jgi:hypothetical protein
MHHNACLKEQGGLRCREQLVRTQVTFTSQKKDFVATEQLEKENVGYTVSLTAHRLINFELGFRNTTY